MRISQFSFCHFLSVPGPREFGKDEKPTTTATRSACHMVSCLQPLLPSQLSWAILLCFNLVTRECFCCVSKLNFSSIFFVVQINIYMMEHIIYIYYMYLYIYIYIHVGMCVKSKDFQEPCTIAIRKADLLTLQVFHSNSALPKCLGERYLHVYGADYRQSLF